MQTLRRVSSMFSSRVLRWRFTFYRLSFFNSFVIIFVVIVLLAALDFWVAKNVSGRILVEKSLFEALYHSLPMQYVTITKLHNMFDGEANQKEVCKIIDRMIQEGYVEESSNRRLGKRVIHSVLTENKLNEVRKFLPQMMICSKSSKQNGLLRHWIDIGRSFCIFNDDVQGTAGVALAGLLGTVRAQGRPLSDFVNQKIVVVRAGSAGFGVTKMAVQAVARMAGISFAEATKNFYLIDKDVTLFYTG